MEAQQPLTPEQENLINDVASSLFQRLEINGEFDLVVNEENTIEIILDTPDTGIVIGYHGEILDSLQLLLSLMVARKLGRFVRVSLEVGDYKKNRSQYLEKLADQIKEKVLEENQEYTLPALRPWERRIVHMYLQNDEQVVTESVDDGKDRTLVVRPKA